MINVRDLETEAERLVRHAAADRRPVDAGVIAQVTKLIREAHDLGQMELREMAMNELSMTRDDPEEQEALHAFLARLDFYGVQNLV